MGGLPGARALRVLSGPRRASSRPVIVETSEGPLFVKLRGAAQGTAALTAEVVVGELADALALPVPRRTLVSFDADLPSDDRDGELLDLLARSRGRNLGFRLLQHPREIRPEDVARLPDGFAVSVLWLDALVLNRDRSPRNPNILLSDGGPWLIDHGAALIFQHDWTAVNEDSPRSVAYPLDQHLFADRVGELAGWDQRLAERLTREVLGTAVGAVPDDFLLPLLSPGSDAHAIERRRQAYAAFLWKRLRAPRSFLSAPQCPLAQADGATSPIP